MLVCWKDETAVDDGIIDTGHRLVIDTINQLNQAVTPAECDSVIARMLPGLEEHLVHQFEHEAALLMQSSPSVRTEHESEHRNLLAVLSVLKDSHQRGADISALLLLNLVCFLVSHLRGTDNDTFVHGHLVRQAA